MLSLIGNSEKRPTRETTAKQGIALLLKCDRGANGLWSAGLAGWAVKGGPAGQGGFDDGLAAPRAG